MTQRCAQLGASPLIAPLACSLVLLAPSRQDLTGISRQVRSNIRRNFVRIISAANLVDVVPFVCSPCDKPARHGFASHLANLRHCEFAAGTSGFPWQHTPLRNALSEQDRSTLVLAGFWLEYQVGAAALHALADSYDVYFVLDASPAKMQAAVQLSQDRLIQAGATPVVVSQVIHEWSLESPDASKSAALNVLLLPAPTSGVVLLYGNRLREQTSDQRHAVSVAAARGSAALRHRAPSRRVYHQFITAGRIKSGCGIPSSAASRLHRPPHRRG